MVTYRIPKDEFEKIYSTVPRLCVDVIIQTDKGVLLSKRDIPPAKGKWHIPGGTVFFEETLEQATKRIAKDELGVDIKPIKILGILEYSTKEEMFGKPVSVVFLAKIASGSLKPDEQTTKIDFFENLPENIILDQKRFIEANLARFKIR